MPVNSEKLEFVQQRIVQLRQFLLSGVPVTSISQDGMSVTFDRAGALAELSEMERQEKLLLYGNRWIRKVDMSGI
ncbi:hypothetical protein FACS18942_05120 [Planctomycetales bacterium]|nr:hypothetical protein FACS18942_05120 [Planctomycetales bacterium]GHT38120.1 hypothetical protein FACS189427_11970 [Planctomycetales bacterium]